MTNKNKKTKGFIKNISKSSLSEFIKRPLPSDDEVEKFDEMLEEEIKETAPFANDSENKVEEIEESLSEIYQDDKGGKINVQELDIKKKRGG